MTAPIAPLPEGAGAALEAMQRACFPDDPWAAESIARILALPGAFGYLAWDGDAPAGFVLASDLGGECEILSLGTLPNHRRRGIARQLLAAVAAEAGRRGSASIVLEVATRNEAALALYRACGFRQAGRRPRYYRAAGGPDDALILRCNLA